MHVSVSSHSNSMVGFSNRRGAPGHQRTVVLTGDVDHQVCRRTRLCEEMEDSQALVDLDLK